LGSYIGVARQFLVQRFKTLAQAVESVPKNGEQLAAAVRKTSVGVFENSGQLATQTDLTARRVFQTQPAWRGRDFTTPCAC